ncbi:helix-turn-helix domain-containing protein [Streptomyces sp. NPDC059861]|uniref:helix-turn-helix domain-containing protein n=1 Tax=Streptomyces sp. NPDC059861 TaxID=3346974 RepID=UPI0036590BBA
MSLIPCVLSCGTGDEVFLCLPTPQVSTRHNDSKEVVDVAKASIWNRHTWSAIRQAKGVTHKQIADACGVYLGSAEKWASGERNPKLNHQVTMAKVLGIPLRVLLADVKDPAIRAAVRMAYND